MASNGSLNAQAQQLSARVKVLVNNDLKEICRNEGLPVSGVKAILQGRILQLIEGFVRSSDVQGLNRLRLRIANHGHAPPSETYAAPSSGYPNTSPHSQPGSYDMQNGYRRPMAQAASRYSNAMRFKESPFYEISDILGDAMTLNITPSHRTTTEKDIRLSQDVCDRLKSDTNYRIMLFSAVSEQPLGQYTRADIAFPSQIEVKINQEEVRANFKGLKNKPGSTRPADITEYVRKLPTYTNKVLITFALTQKASVQKYLVYVALVKKHSADELADRIRRRNVIPKRQVIDEMLRKAQDPDIVFGSAVMSLKDPVSTLRIAIPCRSTVCNHNQCFDCVSFLQLQEQAPTWTCPICNKTVSFEGLAVDEYFQDILRNVASSTDQVTIQPNGEWSHGASPEKPSRRNGASTAYNDDGSDDDLIEIPDYRITNIKTEAVPTPQSLSRTPPFPSREPSSAPRSAQKRKSEVIDLTLSDDDDDDEPPRPAKKVAYNTPNSLPDPSRNGHRPPSYSNSSLHSRPPIQSPSNQNGHTPFRLDLRPPSVQHQSQYGYRPNPPPPPSWGSNQNRGYQL